MVPDYMNPGRRLEPGSGTTGKNTAPYRMSAPDTIDIMPDFSRNRPAFKPRLDMSVLDPADQNVRASPTKSRPADAGEDHSDALNMPAYKDYAHGDLLGATANTNVIRKGVERVPMMATVPCVLPRAWKTEAINPVVGGQDADDADGDLYGATADTSALHKGTARVPMTATVRSVLPRTWKDEANTIKRRLDPYGGQDADDADGELFGATADTDALYEGTERVPMMAKVRSTLPWTWTREASNLLGPPDQDKAEGLTTLMIRNLPTTLWPKVLMNHIDESGFGGLYDILYMPMDFGTRQSKGFAFINFMSEGSAKKFLRAWHQLDAYHPEVISVVFAKSQGKRANIQRMMKAKALRILNPDLKPFVRDLHM